LHAAAAAHLVAPRLVNGALAASHSPVATAGAAASGGQLCAASAGWGGLGSVRWDSTKRKRSKKMNKHKYEKWKKKMRNLTAKNVRGNNK
jgi:hypothetical protein